MKPFIVPNLAKMNMAELTQLFRAIADLYGQKASDGTRRAGKSLPPEPPKPPNPLETEFNSLLADWRRETEFSSDGCEVLLHPAHLAIIALGKPALRFIFKDMATGRGDWLTALDAIFLRRSPIKGVDERNAKLMREAWLTWAHNHGYA
jgi:hypothetical protein